MARENQGLQYALIAFVLLTIILGVTTFIFLRQYQDANKRAAANEKQAAGAQQTARTAVEDAENLKRMMGFAPSDSMQTVQDGFKKDMAQYAGSYPEDARFYKQVVERQGKDIVDLNVSLNDQTAKVKDLNDKLTSLNAVTVANLAPFQTAAEQARKEREAEAAKFAAAREQSKTDQAKLAGDLETTRKEKDAKITDLDNQAKSLRGDLAKAGETIERLKGEIHQVTDPKPETFLGEVRWVNQKNRVVWINLGRDDSLRPQITFSVFPAGAHDAVETDSKGSIEVTKILNSHLAEARIVDDRVANPILPGDRIYTSVWNIGEKRHFALAGFFDLDNNGQSDLELLQTIIEINGGVIDAKRDAEGKRQGAMSVNTRYLVLGSQPGATATPEEEKDYTDMQIAAEKLKIEVIPVEKFLDRMGWKRDVQVLPYAGGSDRSFPVRVEESPQVSGGKISDLFKPRRPPRTGGGSTY